MRLTKRNLRGIWAGIPLCWDDNDRLEEGTYRRNLARLVGDGIRSVYINGTAGEFYALSWDDFRLVVDTFLDELEGSGVLTQVGCTGTNTADVVRMMEYASENGADGVQVAVPFWKRMSESELIGFFGDVSRAVPDLSIVHYNNPNSKWDVPAPLYEKIVEVCPNLVGIKSRPDLAGIQWLRYRLPNVGVFVGEDVLASACMVGAVGSCATLPYINPQFALRYWKAIEQEDWAEALECQAVMVRFFVEVEGACGYDGPGIDKLLGIASGYLHGTARMRKPYASPTADQIEAARAVMRDRYPSLVYGG